MPEEIPKQGLPCVIPGAAAVIPNPGNPREVVVVMPDARLSETRITLGVFALCSDGSWRGVRGRGLSFQASLIPQIVEGLAAAVPVS